MITARNFGALLALGAVTVLPACSMFGGDSGSRSSQYSQNNSPTAPASYGTASSSTGTSGTVAPVSPDMIRKVQATLKQAGDYNARVDGVWGPQTETGVRTWQQAHNVGVNGEIDMATLQSMNISADNQASNQVAPSNQPAGNPNYSTNATRTDGSNYSSNANQMPPNSPTPTTPATDPNANNAAPASTAPNATGGTTTH